MKILILGHTGFLGKNVHKHLKSSESNQLACISSADLDLTSQDSHKYLRNYLDSQDIVVFCSGVKKQLGDNIDSFNKNSLIVDNFLKGVVHEQPKKIIFFSSAAVYGEDIAYTEKIDEETSVQPRTYYGKSKFTAENLLTKVCIENNIKLIKVRPPLIYGKDDLSRGYGPTGFTYKAMNNEEIVLWGDGSEYREFVYIDDVGKSIARLINSEYEGVLNLVSGCSYTFNDILDCLKNILGRDIKIEFRERSKKKVNHHYSNQLFKEVIPSFKFTNLEEGLKKLTSQIRKSNEKK